jgi:RimJ/RimL family protein N-acetyltransferase
MLGSVAHTTPAEAKVIPSLKPTMLLKPMSYRMFRGPVSSWQNTMQVLGADSAIYGEQPSGWYLACKDDLVIGSLASINKANATSYLGYFFIKEEYRLQGFGINTLKSVMQHDVEKQHNFHTFMCTEAMIGMYEKWGFTATSFDTIYRYKPSSALSLSGSLVSAKLTTDDELIQQILAYDKSVQLGYDRQAFLINWLNKPRSQTNVAIQDGQVVGYSVASDFVFPTDDMTKIHRRIAPIYADTPEVAEQLLSATLQEEKTSSVIVDTDGNNPNAAKVLQRVGLFSASMKFARMTQPGAEPYYDHDRVYSPAWYGTGP